MPRILLFGATGYLGSAIAQALLLSGNHTVYGLSRSAAKASALAGQEIIPVVCPDPAKDPEPYLSAINKHRIDIVIDATVAYGDSLSFLKHIASASRSRPSYTPKLGYIYVSGLWVHGSSPSPITDRDPAGLPHSPNLPADMVVWRPDLERAVLAAQDVLDVCVLRPAQMYGYASAGWTPVFLPISGAVKAGEESVEVQVPADAMVAVCHVDDVAAAVRCAAEKIESIGSNGSRVYPIFDITAPAESLRSILQEFADVVSNRQGKTKVELIGEGDDVYLKALGSTVKASSARARQYLGWTARRSGFADGMEVYAGAWESVMGGGK